MLIAARAMQKGLEVLKPRLVEDGIEPIGNVLVGTVKGDLHDIGKNLLIMSLEGAGFEVIDLGTNVPPEKFVSAIKEHRPGVLGLSALLTTTMPAMKDTIEAIERAGLRTNVKIMIGGAPVTQEFCDEIGADFYGADSPSGSNYARSVVTGGVWIEKAKEGKPMKKAPSPMTSRERVLAAVKGRPVDRVPVMYWFNPHAACRMMADFSPAPSRLWNLVGKQAWKAFSKGCFLLNEEQRNALPLLLQIYANAEYPLALDADIAEVPFGTTAFWGRLDLSQRKVRARDAFGSLRGMGGIYLDVIEPAIKNIEDLKSFKLPDVSGDEHYARIRKFRKDHPGACIICDNFGVQDLPQTQIWEMSKMMMALYDHPEEVKAFQKRFADWNIEVARRSIKAGADIIFLYDDYGYNNRTLISMEMWKEFTYPHLKRQIAAAHDAGGLVMLHSCGYQKPFLPYYVEAGLDILQSLQPKAGNDFGEAYTEYGDRLAFCTGIDVQLGESMSASELRESIINAYRIGGRNGRHILGMTHLLQYTMPTENIRAILDTVREIQAGKVDG